MDHLTKGRCPTCGRNHISDIACQIRCCGNDLSIAGSSVPNREIVVIDHGSRLGDECHHENQRLFQLTNGCGCHDAIALMNRWGVEKTLSNIDKLVGMIAKRNKHFSDEQIGSAIIDACSNHKSSLSQTRKPIDQHQQQSLDDHCIAVTSLSLLPHHRNRQSVCLDSWRRFGLSVIVVNRTEEIEELRSTYPQVGRWITNDTASEHYSRNLPRINHLADVATEINHTILLVNSDIEIYGDQRKIIEPLSDDKQIVGIRWNYDGQDHQSAKREQWGLDAFSFTPEFARSLPQLALVIGRPVWDYWIPLHSRTVGQEMHFIGDRLFYHQSHKMHWRQADWIMGAKMVNDTYGYMLKENNRTFRHSLPFQPR